MFVIFAFLLIIRYHTVASQGLFLLEQSLFRTQRVRRNAIATRWEKNRYMGEDLNIYTSDDIVFFQWEMELDDVP